MLEFKSWIGRCSELLVVDEGVSKVCGVALLLPEPGTGDSDGCCEAGPFWNVCGADCGGAVGCGYEVDGGGVVMTGVDGAGVV